MGLINKVVVVGAAVAFAKSEQGKKMISEARVRYDTPANREKARAGFAQATEVVKGQIQARKAGGYS